MGEGGGGGRGVFFRKVKEVFENENLSVGYLEERVLLGNELVN